MTVIIRSYSDAAAAVRAERNSRSPRAFSISRVLASMSGEYGQLDGYEAEVLKEIGMATRGYHDSQRVQLPIELLADPTVNPATLARDLSAGAAAAGGYLVGAKTLPCADILRPWSTVIQAGATVLNGDVSRAGHGNIFVPKISADQTGYWLSAEGGGVTQSDPGFDKVTLSPKSGGVLTKFSRQLAKQGNVADAVLQTHMLRIVGAMLDRAAIAGTGASGQPTGITNTDGVSSSLGVDYLACVLAECNSALDWDLQKFGFVTHPTVRSHLRRNYQPEGLRRQVWATKPEGERLEDWPAFVTNSCPDDTMIAGPWQDCLIALWGAPILEINPFEQADFKSGIISARVLLDMDVAAIHPNAWMKFTDIGTD